MEGGVKYGAAYAADKYRRDACCSDVSYWFLPRASSSFVRQQAAFLFIVFNDKVKSIQLFLPCDTFIVLGDLRYLWHIVSVTHLFHVKISFINSVNNIGSCFLKMILLSVQPAWSFIEKSEEEKNSLVLTLYSFDNVHLANLKYVG